jgi:hypothetical protein
VFGLGLGNILLRIKFSEPCCELVVGWFVGRTIPTSDYHMEADQYRRRAERCIAKAESAPNAELRAAHIDMAAIWMRFAERAERYTPGAQEQQHIQSKKNPE